MANWSNLSGSCYRPFESCIRCPLRRVVAGNKRNYRRLGELVTTMHVGICADGRRASNGLGRFSNRRNSRTDIARPPYDIRRAHRIEDLRPSSFVQAGIELGNSQLVYGARSSFHASCHFVPRIQIASESRPCQNKYLGVPLLASRTHWL